MSDTKVRISLSDLITLSRHAQHLGTERQFIALALDWATQAQDEIDRLRVELIEMKRTWIEPKPVINAPTIKHSRLSWPFMELHDHEPQEHTGLSVPETPT